MNKKLLTHPILLLILILVVTSIACESSSPTSVPTVSTATSEISEQGEILDNDADDADDPEPTIAPTETPEPKIQYLGDVVEEIGYILSAIAIEDPTTPGILYSPEAGKKLIAVEIILGNVSEESLSVNPLYATLIDSEGYTYGAELAGRDNQIFSGQLSIGEKARGWVAFEIPEGSTPASIKYEVELFSSKFLQASLTPAPDEHISNTEILSFLPPPPDANLGDVYEQYNYSLTASAIEDPTTPGMFYDAREGYKLIAVEIIVGNVSGETLSVNPLYTTLVDNNGYVYDVELAGRSGQIDTVSLGQGEKVKGWVAFEIPVDATPASIKYLVELFSDNYLIVGLTE
jgi:hypothetical protein